MQAYAEAIHQRKILTDLELKGIVEGLEIVRKEVRPPFPPPDPLTP